MSQVQRDVPSMSSQCTCLTHALFRHVITGIGERISREYMPLLEAISASSPFHIIISDIFIHTDTWNWFQTISIFVIEQAILSVLLSENESVCATNVMLVEGHHN